MTNSDERITGFHEEIIEKSFSRFQIAKACVEAGNSNPAIDIIVEEVTRMKKEVLKWADKIGLHQKCRNLLENKTCAGDCCSIYVPQVIKYQEFYIAFKLLSKEQRMELEKCFLKTPNISGDCFFNNSGCFFQDIETKPAICANFYCSNSDIKQFSTRKSIEISTKLAKMDRLLNPQEILKQLTIKE